MADVTCVECEGDVPVEEGTLQGEIIQCPHCGAELEVTGVNPFTVDVAPDVEEDWGE